MKNLSQAAELIKALRVAKGKTQAQFAAILGVTQPMVSAWEGGSDEPSREMFAKLGNLASYPDNLWFWQQAGIDQQAMLSAAEQVLKEGGAPATEREITRVRPYQQTGQATEGPDLVLPARFVSNPLSTRYLVIDGKLASAIFPIGDVVVLDVSAEKAVDLRPLWGEIVLVDLTRPKDTAGLRMTEFWKEGLNIGRLRCKQYSLDPFYWLATLGPFDDADTRYSPGDTATIVGTWRHPGPPKDPIPGSPRERTSRERQKLYAQYTRVRERARGGSIYYRTPEVEQAEKALHEADILLSQQERDEMREAEEEAKLQAPIQMRLTEGCRILGRVICWFRPARQEVK
jgi:transcriptional regulator with XRE-family HTH domain